jgi:hypothetical protein
VVAGSGGSPAPFRGRWGVRSAPPWAGNPPYKGAAASSCTPAAAEAGATSQTSTGARDRGRAGDGPAGIGGRGRRRTRRLHAVVRTPRGASVRATPGEGAALGWRAAQKPRRVRRRRGARRRVTARRGVERPNHLTVPWFRRV